MNKRLAIFIAFTLVSLVVALGLFKSTASAAIQGTKGYFLCDGTVSLSGNTISCTTQILGPLGNVPTANVQVDVTCEGDPGFLNNGPLPSFNNTGQTVDIGCENNAKLRSLTVTDVKNKKPITPGTTVDVSLTGGTGCNLKQSFFGIPAWYKYLGRYQRIDSFGSCHFDFGDKIEGTSAFALVGLGIVDILLKLIGVIAVAFVIIGGFKYVLSQGEPDKTKGALSTIVNACIGLAIAIVASGVVAFIGNKLG